MSKKEDLLTLEIIKEYFDYKDGMLFWNRNVYQTIKKGSFAGCYTKNGYYKIWFNNQQYLGSRIIFFLHKGYFPKFVDHEDRNPRNNKIENLREATCRQNQRNKTSAKNSSSKYLGISYIKNIQKYRAAINIGRKSSKTIGTFKNEIKAALAYNREAVRYFGEFANLNIITL